MKTFFTAAICGISLLVFASMTVLAQPTGKSIVDEECSKCHDTKRIYSANKNPSEWESTVNRMIKKGAKIKPEEKAELLKYLNTLNK
jgi:cytochrome c5